MKRVLFFSLITFIFSLVSCNFIDTSKKQTGITAPNITKSSGSDTIIITPTTVASSTYINIFREDGDSNIYNLGQIVKTENYTSTGEVNFTDYYTSGDKKYSYFARYKTSSGYHVSLSSGIYNGAPAAGTDNEVSLQVDTSAGNSKITITYDSAAFTLKLKESELQIPETYDYKNSIDTDSIFTPMIAINNGNQTRLFELTEKTITEETTGSDGTTTSTDVTYWFLDMRSKFPESFLNVELSIQGIVGQEKEEISDSESDDGSSQILYSVYHWTLPLGTDLIEISYTDSSVSKIIVSPENDTSDLLDYTSEEAASSS